MPNKQIIKNQKVVDDQWQIVSDDENTLEGNIIVSTQRWHANKATLQSHDGKLGILIEFDQHIDAIKGDLDHFEVIAIEFQSYTDGRGYSYATLLRRMGWKKEIRAVGDVLRDQIFYMHRCGFDAFDIRADRNIHDALHAFSEFSVAYQPAINNL